MCHLGIIKPNDDDDDNNNNNNVDIIIISGGGKENSSFWNLIMYWKIRKIRKSCFSFLLLKCVE